MHDALEDPRGHEMMPVITKKPIDPLVVELAQAKDLLWKYAEIIHRMEQGSVTTKEYEEFVSRVRTFIEGGTQPKKLGA